MQRTAWILPDQLSLSNAALQAANKDRDILLFIESRRALGRLPYHRHRLLLLLSAMRHFAREREKEGWSVRYFTLADAPDAAGVLGRHIEEDSPGEILLTEPNNDGEREGISALQGKLPIPLKILPTRQFLCSREEFAVFSSGKKRLLMEGFYREMRRRTGLLMDRDGSPEGGSWNYDAENRAGYRDWVKAGKPLPPTAPRVEQDDITRGVADELERFVPQATGEAGEFSLPVTRRDALLRLEDFVKNRLPGFGTWQDLMVSGKADLFHSLLSPMLNIGLLDPLECARAAEASFREGRAPLAAAEGFIRQIIGWREFVNGVYWLKMPAYAGVNALAADRPLPEFFWNADTDMNCLRQVLGETLRHGFNHHIQRLMILGNFLLLAGIRPDEALNWFNSMYVDAHDWVMAANLLGMALHADGGFMATKPYACGAAYISRMSDYCGDCRYSPSPGRPNPCPFNLLYWNFYDRHAERFAGNPRTAMPVRSWRKRPEADRREIVGEALKFLENLAGEPGGD
jgi:deoxyribodipyrimidine photolyase-related protein